MPSETGPVHQSALVSCSAIFKARSNMMSFPVRQLVSATHRSKTNNVEKMSPSRLVLAIVSHLAPTNHRSVFYHAHRRDANAVRASTETLAVPVLLKPTVMVMLTMTRIHTHAFVDQSTVVISKTPQQHGPLLQFLGNFQDFSLCSFIFLCFTKEFCYGIFLLLFHVPHCNSS
ncbi:hypothetical protein ANCCAN_05598 [Ancylostoma caninum]|uniref:Uncharacterized protein n=1 Tax=Ancylostoma caninum TaxID=29170 RepID=A0A368GY75_ANCCA|nr:hypothetical protein ANCCAN_05598 [Ancylostoma caninum]